MKLVVRSIKNVFRSPVRLILVVALLGMSLMFVAAMASLATNSQQQLTTVRKQIGTTITIEYAATPGSSPQQGNGVGNPATPGSSFPGVNTPVIAPPGISNSMVTKVKRIPGVVSTQESLGLPYREDSLHNLSANSLPIMINGISEDSTNFTLSGVVPTLVSGRGFRGSDANADVAMMSQALAQKNHLNVGSTFTLNGTAFTLIGLYTTSSSFTENTIVIPLTTMQKLYHLDGVDLMTVTAASYGQVETVAARLRDLFGTHFKVVTQATQYSNVLHALGVAQNSIQATLVASFLIAAAVIVFAVLMLVRERTAEIAILKTIGASHLQILRQFWTEILALSTTAAVLAIFLLVTLGSFLAHFFDINASSLVNADAGGPGANHPLIMDNGVTTSTTSTISANLSNTHLGAATLNVQTVLIILAVGIGLALLTSLIPTWFVSHLKPAQVLRKAN